MIPKRPLNSSAELACPFCGEVSAVFLDEGGGENQTFVEDCAVCCRPRIVHLEATGGDVHIWCERSD